MEGRVKSRRKLLEAGGSEKKQEWRKGAGGILQEGKVGALWRAREGAGRRGRSREVAGGRERAREGAGGRGRAREGAGGRKRAREGAGERGKSWR